MNNETPLVRFLKSGELILPEKPEITTTGQTEAFTLLRELYDRDALDQAGEAPEFQPEAALWAWHKLERLARLLVDRDLGAEEVKAWAALPCPVSASDPACAYSADLILRHVPILARLGRQMAPSDPLLQAVHQLLASWPLSAVGCPLDPLPDPHPLLNHPFLGPVYLERVLAREDLDRARHPRVHAWLLSALSPVPTLRPSFYAQVKALAGAVPSAS